MKEDTRMNAGNLDFIFNPKNVAFIGISRQESKNVYVKSMIASNFKGKIFLINPKASMVMGYKVFPNIRDIQDDIDLAVIAVPAHLVRQSVVDCVEAHVKGIIIITAGFAEMGEKGKQAQEDMVAIAREGGARIVGPNCLGIFSSFSGLNTTGSYPAPTGDIALVSQSGNVGIVLLNLARSYDVGFSKFISLGNQADIPFHEYIRYLRDDPDTKVIAIYAEGFKDGRSFMNAASEVTLKKPIVILKAGKTEAGARSAISHTGFFAGDDAISRCALRQVGLIRVETYYELLAVAETLSKLPPLENNRIAILGGGGGHGTIMADTVVKYGLDIPLLSSQTQQKLKPILPQFASTKNPVDIVGGGKDYPTEFYECARVCLEDRGIMGVIIFGMFGDYRKEEENAEEKHIEVAGNIAQLVRERHKPIIMQTTAAERIEGIGLKSPLRKLRSNGIPVFESVEIAARSMSALFEYGSFLRRRNSLNMDVSHEARTR